MNPVGRLKRDVAPVCSTCGRLMIVASREIETSSQRRRFADWLSECAASGRPRRGTVLNAESTVLGLTDAYKRRETFATLDLGELMAKRKAAKRQRIDTKGGDTICPPSS